MGADLARYAAQNDFPPLSTIRDFPGLRGNVNECLGVKPVCYVLLPL